jgi:hypothetical protein
MLREFPNSPYPFLRFQIGLMETRAQQFPKYEGMRQVGYYTPLEKASVFRLLGFGSTLARAKKMAAKAQVSK